MRKINKILAIIEIFIMLVPTISVYANVIEENITDETIKLEYYDENIGWKEMEEKVIKKVTEDGESIIYNIGNIEINSNKLDEIDNKKLKVVAKNGYPSVTVANLKLDSEIQCYVATKIALVWSVNEYDKEKIVENVRLKVPENFESKDEEKENCKENITDNIESNINEICNNDISENIIIQDEDSNITNDTNETSNLVNVELKIENNIEISNEKDSNNIESNIEAEISDSRDKNEEEIDSKENIEDEIKTAYKESNLVKQEQFKNILNSAYDILEKTENELQRIEKEENSEDDEKEENNNEDTDLKEEDNIVEVKKEPGLEVVMENKSLINSSDEISYGVKVKNKGDTIIEDAKYYNIIDIEKVNVVKMYTGTYNAELNFNVYYRTNKNNEYILLEEELSSTVNNLIEFDKIKLEEDDEIAEIRIDFSTIPVGFESIDDMKIITKTKNGSENEKIANYNIFEGEYQKLKISEDNESTIQVYNVQKSEKLPKTGY